ncbi:cyclase family protein [Nocardia sp. NPDC047038]|uniref:cyclase family protein n=1 Tax=Nocardia sp. NPDC047038 TaxID=3154338 RepID=UPI0033E813B6
MCAPQLIDGGDSSEVSGGDVVGTGVKLIRERGFGRVVDLTHTLTPDFPVWELVSKRPEFGRVACMADNQYNAGRLDIYEHVGTHIDAPLHFDDAGLSVDAIPAENLVAPLAVIRIAERAARDATAAVTVRDIRDWERAHGPLPQGAVVVMESGWAQRVPIPGAFLNHDERTDTYRWPGFSAEAADFLIHQREVVGIGVDSTGLDRGSDRAIPVHRTFLPSGRYGLEALNGLPDVPDAGATLVVGASKHRGGTGGPARIFALY